MVVIQLLSVGLICCSSPLFISEYDLYPILFIICVLQLYLDFFIKFFPSIIPSNMSEIIPRYLGLYSLILIRFHYGFPYFRTLTYAVQYLTITYFISLLNLQYSFIISYFKCFFNIFLFIFFYYS